MLYSRGKGRYDAEYDELWDRLVPQSGQADTVQGELARAIGKLASEAYRNGNMNWDRGFRTFVTFIRRTLCDGDSFGVPSVRQIESDLKDIGDFGNGTQNLTYEPGEDVYDRLTDRVVEWCRKHPHPIPLPRNPKLNR